jgi:hypothetical protein
MEKLKIILGIENQFDMGMFDSAYIKCSCPKCGVEKVRECQTKDTDCYLDVWKPGDMVDESLDRIYCITSFDCGTYYDLIIDLDKGKLTENYKIVEDRWT